MAEELESQEREVCQGEPSEEPSEDLQRDLTLRDFQESTEMDTEEDNPKLDLERNVVHGL
jgi:hypothetical protein